MATARLSDKIPAVSPYAHGLRAQLDAGGGKAQARFTIGNLQIEMRTTNDGLWAIIRRDGAGGLALRTAYLPVPFECTVMEKHGDDAARLKLTSVLGEHEIVVWALRDELERLRVKVCFTPSSPLLMPFVPRDLYPLDANDDPLGAVGNIEASQRGVNAGILYFHLDEPAFGNVLYFQNLTALNDYCLATETKPDEIVGGAWPELGTLLPTTREDGTPASEPL